MYNFFKFIYQKTSAVKHHENIGAIISKAFAEPFFFVRGWSALTRCYKNLVPKWPNCNKEALCRLNRQSWTSVSFRLQKLFNWGSGTQPRFFVGTPASTSIYAAPQKVYHVQVLLVLPRHRLVVDKIGRVGWKSLKFCGD